MKKHSSLKRILAVCLSLAMVLSLMPGAALATGPEGTSVNFEEIDPGEVSADLRGNSGLTADRLDLDDGSPYSSTDKVRVMIVLPREAAISLVDEGMEAADPAVAAYREELQAEQEYAAGVISEEALDGEPLDVVWNLTLAVNAISANVEYGQIEDIAKVGGVQAVYIERRYDPMTAAGGAADLNNIPAQYTTGAASMKLDGYTGAGMRIAVVDTGTAEYHQSFDEGAFEHSLAQQAEEKGMTLDQYKETLNLLTLDEITDKIEKLNVYQRMEDKYADWGGYWDDWTIPLLYKSSKLPFGFNYIDSNISIDHVTGFDEETYEYSYSEHGSHVAGIAAANSYIPNPDGDGYVDAAEAVGVTGVAPDAQIITLKVFGENGGAYSSDNFAAIEDAMVLGCDVVNLSLGSSSGFVTASGEYRYVEGALADENPIDSWIDGVMDRITKNGIIMCVSAGNSGNWAEGDDYSSYFDSYGIGLGMMYTDEGGTYNVGQPSTYHNTMSVASSDNVGGVATRETVVSGKGKTVKIDPYPANIDGEYFDLWNTLGTAEGREYDLVFLGDPTFLLTGSGAADETIYGGHVETVGEGDDAEDVFVPADISGYDLEGKIVLVARGNGVSFADKYDIAYGAGAAAVVMYNNVLNGEAYFSPTILSDEIPCGMITREAAAAVYALCTKTDNAYGGKAAVTTGVFIDYDESARPAMSYFSSWGATGALTIKPEITAPGGSIYSVNGGEGGWSDTDQYENMSGTSMAAPHFSGLAALMKQYIRSNGKELLTKAQTAAGSSLTERQLAQSLLMSTAEPLMEGDMPYSVRNQGAGLANVRSAASAKTFIMVDGQPDGKVKVELGDGTAPWNFSFSLYNLTGEVQTYDLSAQMMTTGTTEYYGWYFATNEMAPLDATVSFGGGSRVTVPANGSVKVSATVTVSSAAVEKMESLGYTNGFYVEGFVYAKSVDTTREGVLGVTHSIPILGWYGSWTDISMYDYGTLLDLYYAEEMERYPHLAWYTSPAVRNALMFTADGGDPMDPDDANFYTGNLYADTRLGLYGDSRYIPARNALNNNGGSWWQPTWFWPTLIRNAIAARVQVTDSKTGVPYYQQDYNEPFYGAYAHPQVGILVDASEYDVTPIEYDFSGIPEGTDLTISVSFAPEYYENADGSIRWNELGGGATLSFPFRVDNTAPTMLAAEVSSDGSTLTVTARDNNYIAFIALLDGSGSAMVANPVCPDMDEDQRGQTFVQEFSLNYLDGNKAVVAVCDYAGNERFYALNLSDGSYPGGGYGDLVGFQTGFYLTSAGPEETQSWVSFDADVDRNETALFSSDTEFTSADYAGGVVYAQDARGGLYGILYNDMVNGVTDLEMARITRLERVYQDMAYNYADGLLYGLYVDESDMVSYIDAIDLNNGPQTELAVCSLEGVYSLGLACDDSGRLYLMGLENGDGAARLYVGTRDSAAALAMYDLNGDYGVDVLDAQDLMACVIRGQSLKNRGQADMDGDGALTTRDVHQFLDMLDGYQPEDEYHFAEAFDTGLDMNYLQAMTWDHNTETLYWARCHYVGGWDGIAAELWKIDAATGSCRQTGALSGETYAMFAPLTRANAAKEAHSNVPAVEADANGRPVLVDSALTLAVGGSRRLTYDISPWYAENQDVSWKSSDASVATVDRGGVVTAVGEGSCVITVCNANDSSLSSSCTVTVADLKLEIRGTYSEMGGNIGEASDSYLYTFTMGGGDSAMRQGSQIYNPYAKWMPDYSYGQKMASAILIGGDYGDFLWTCEWGNTGMIQSVDIEWDPGMINPEAVIEPIGGDALFGMTYSGATNRVTGIMNYDLFVDLPNFTEWVMGETDVPDMDARFDEDWMANFDWHKLDLSGDLNASDMDFNTGEAGNGSIVDVVICGIADIGSAGPVVLTGDFLGGRGASGDYTPDTTMVLLDNVGRLWYIDELTNMTKDGDTYTGDCGAVSGGTGIHTWKYADDNYSVFVIREIVETPLLDMYWQGTMPRYSYHFSDLYYAGEDTNGNEVYLLSLYDVHNDGTTNQLCMLIMDAEGGTLIELGDTGEYNVIATIYDAYVDMSSLPSGVSAAANSEAWESSGGAAYPLAAGPYAG